MKNVWKRYVEAVMDGASQVQGQRDTGIAQTTIGRWLNGEKVPTDAAKVAAFALGYGRNVLEAFVAAGMLSIADAQRGLDESSIAMLEQLDDATVDELAVRRGRKTAEPSVGDPNVAHLIGEPSAAAPEPRSDVEGDEDPEGP